MLKTLAWVLCMTASTFASQDRVIEQAQEARSRAYCPYSHYPVGVALVTASGEIVQGCNVENASYGLTMCAERSAIFSALSQGRDKFKKMVIITRDGGAPCGACRQVLNEFNPLLEIITMNEKGEMTHHTTLDKLLPTSFGPRNLDESTIDKDG